MTETPVRIAEPVIAINLNQTYKQGINADDLYDCTRGIWRLSREHAEKAHYAFAVYQSVIREVYEIEQWLPAGSTTYQRRHFTPKHLQNRYEFLGKVAPKAVREQYVGRHMPEPSSQNPIRYYNC